jgi:ankyrin repeat protein
MIDEQDWRAFIKRAMMKKDTAALRELVEGGLGLNQSGPGGAMSPMIKAISWSKGIECMLKLGAEPDFQDEKSGSTALMAAAKGGGHVKSVELLLAAGADVNIRSNKGFSALWWSCLQDGKKPEKIALMLIDAGADVHGLELTAAAGGSTETVIRRMIDAGADVNRVDEISTCVCPLHAAIEKKRRGAVEQLLKAGAVSGIKLPDRVGDHAGKTLLELAEFRGQNQIVELLKSV